MILLAILTTISFLITYGYRRTRKKERISESIFFGFFAVCASAIVWIMICLIITDLTPYHQQFTEREKTEIVAMTSSIKTEGNFFLASGRIESVPYYFFYYKTPDGGKKIGKVMAEYATIYEEKREDAYMVKCISYRSPKDLESWTWAVPSIFNRDERIRGYKIHIPEGSIKNEIDLSLTK